MTDFNKIIHEAAAGKLFIQGNASFALGVLHAGFSLADGYPGTPCTDVIENLRQAPTLIRADWSINEAVAVGLGVGHAIAGFHSVITMKVPGLFQAADVVASAAHTRALRGALVLFVATDHAPSSSQYLVDARPFLESLMVPVIEPRNHQDLYLSAQNAQWLSVKWETPVVVLCSSALCHSEGFVTAAQNTRKTMNECIGTNSTGMNKAKSVLLPEDARISFDRGVSRKIPGIRRDFASPLFVKETGGNTEWGVLCSGEADLIITDVLTQYGLHPKRLSLSGTVPLPIETIKTWWQSVSGPVFLFEDGERFVEYHLLREGIDVIGKASCPTVTHWSPDLALQLLERAQLVQAPGQHEPNPCSSRPDLNRPPSICAGCPYKAISLVLQNLKQSKLLDLVFGDIGCSTLLHFQNALDINLCMGASESMRQGYVLAKPQSAARVISLIGDSSECHSGMDATRNAAFRNIPGVKVILDNQAVAMTGAQETPTTLKQSGFDLTSSLQSQGIKVSRVNAYDVRNVKQELETALHHASAGECCALIVEGACLAVVGPGNKKGSRLFVDETRCVRCGRCNVCPAIEVQPGKCPIVNESCSLCGSGAELCVQACAHQALRVRTSRFERRVDLPETAAPPVSENSFELFDEVPLPDDFRMVVCGVGGQGNLFFGRLLAEVIRPYLRGEQNLIQGEIHGMAQRGGVVSSTFGFGRVHSPVFASGSVDLLVGMEKNEVSRKQYLRLLKPDAVIVFQDIEIPPVAVPGYRKYANEAVDAFWQWKYLRIHPDAIVKNSSQANVFLLGVISNLEPFAQIPDAGWERGLKCLSKSPGQYRKNRNSFYSGKHHRSADTIAFVEGVDG